MNRRRFLCSISAAAAKLSLPPLLIAPNSLSRSLLDGLAPAATPIPVPASIAHVASCCLSLNGTWRFLASPQPGQEYPSLESGNWVDVSMPNELFVLGHVLAKDYEYPLRRRISIPADFAGQHVFLRFDGVYSQARIWANGHFVREHFGGFTSWDCDITQFVVPGKEADIVIGITDRSDDISQASYYAKHVIAGILRDVRLIALPKIFVRHLHLNATLDPEYRDGILELGALLNEAPARNAELRLTLRDAEHLPVTLEKTVFTIHGSMLEPISVRMPAPRKWDSEHPDLYDLSVELRLDGKLAETIERTVGFRKVEQRGNQLLVNGQPVLLRGVCRHSVHPTMGRVVPKGIDEKDAALLRAGHINFVRTSHYPPSEQFLAACDRQGIYIEEETAVCWSLVQGGPSSDPAFANRFASQFQEMIGRDHWHPCVIMWSLGNESRWGTNMAEELRIAREHDPSRPRVFSYSDTAELENREYDIYSKHYADVNGELGSSVHPVLHDEFAHVSCYNTAALALDPGVRNFWGESIKRFSDNFAASDGCLGGSIWAGIDEVFLLPETITGYGAWGLVDGWRREKPEYWLARKAYSPVRIAEGILPYPGGDMELKIHVRNAHDHTDLSELDIQCSVNDDAAKTLKMQLSPRATGILRIPARKWQIGDIVRLNFVNRAGRLVDQFVLTLGAERRARFDVTPAELIMTESASGFQIRSGDFTVSISRITGMIENASLNGTTLIEGGPYLDLGRGRTAYWLLKHLNVAKKDGNVTVRVTGEGKHTEGFATVPIEYELQVAGDRTLRLRYRLPGKSSADQIGMAFLMPKEVDRITWHRRALWSVYPNDHIGRPRGTAMRDGKHPPAEYGKKPTWPWSADMHDFFLQGREQTAHQATNDFRALKEHVYFAACALAGSEARLRIEADGNLAARSAVEHDGRVLMTAFNYWRFPSLQWGNYLGVSGSPPALEYEAVFRLSDQREQIEGE